MDLIHRLLDFILHIDKHLIDIVNEYDKTTYLILALIIFCETGLVVTPFLPGDSLLFAAGAIAATGSLSIALLVIILFAAAFIGDNTNYFIGNFLGHKLVASKRKIIRKEYLDKTHAFYENHGGKTVIIARFMPIIRTFAPFVAGLGSMTYRRFLLFCIAGNILWIGSFSIAGYAFGNIEIVKRNFTIVVFSIIIISILPMIIAVIRQKYFNKKSA
ncbi:MAG: DedA family protein [Bacteroidetes bacterium]|nr:DedA family protein [Bacteroidota bacterium]